MISFNFFKIFIIFYGTFPYFVFLSDLSKGWAPAILNSQQEADFLKLAQKMFSHDRSYWLGGSTSSQPWSNISLSEYSPDDSGNDNYLW